MARPASSATSPTSPLPELGESCRIRSSRRISRAAVTAVSTIVPAIEMRVMVLIPSTTLTSCAVAVAGSARTTQLPSASDQVPIAIIARSTAACDATRNRVHRGRMRFTSGVTNASTRTTIAGTNTSRHPGPGSKKPIRPGTPICRATVSTTAMMPISRMDVVMLTDRVCALPSS
jgi:hypothetical protein